MTDFDDYNNDEPDDACSICGDPLCPGCESSVQSRIIKLASIPVGIVVLALVLRWMFLGENQNPITASLAPAATSSSAEEADESSSTTANSTSSTAPIAVPIISGVLTEDSIRSVVQVVQIDARGPCSYGSGTVVGDGITVLTNFHVIESDKECPQARIEVWTVASIDEKPSATHKAVVMRVNEIADLAILRITPISSLTPSLKPLPIQTSVSVGEEIFVIGFPGIGGSSIMVSKGVVSGYTKEFNVSWIKTDASISGGNSGGAALNSRGELVGVPTRASVSENGDVVDCRPTVDSNRDGSIDEYDACQPIGGFLNLLSPASSADDLLKQLTSADVTEPEDEPSNEDDYPESDSDESSSNDPRFGTCKEAIRNGYGPYYEGEDYEYNWYIDADNDGVACER